MGYDGIRLEWGVHTWVTKKKKKTTHFVIWIKCAMNTNAVDSIVYYVRKMRERRNFPATMYSQSHEWKQNKKKFSSKKIVRSII